MKKMIKRSLMLLLSLQPVTSVAEDVTRNLQVNGFATASAAWPCRSSQRASGCQTWRLQK